MIVSFPRSLTFLPSLFQKKPVKDKLFAKRNAFMLCTIHKAVNDALIDFKRRMCTHGEKINLEKTLRLG